MWALHRVGSLIRVYPTHWTEGRRQPFLFYETAAKTANSTFLILGIWMIITPHSINHRISINFFFPASFVSWRLIDQRQAKRWPLTPKWLQVLTQERVRGCNRNSFAPQCAAPLGGGVCVCVWASSFCMRSQTGSRYHRRYQMCLQSRQWNMPAEPDPPWCLILRW